MRTSDHLHGKSMATLTSPFYRNENISCVQFYYRMQSTKKNTWTALTLSLHSDQGSPEVVWRQFTVHRCSVVKCRKFITDICLATLQTFFFPSVLSNSLNSPTSFFRVLSLPVQRFSLHFVLFLCFLLNLDLVVVINDSLRTNLKSSSWSLEVWSLSVSVKVLSLPLYS